MTRKIMASELGTGLIAAIRASGIDRFIFSSSAIESGLNAVIKVLEKNEIEIDNKFKFRDDFEGIGFRYALFDLGTSGTFYIQLSEKGAEDYFRHCLKDEDFDFFKALAKRFLNRARRYTRCERVRRERNFDVYKQLKDKRRKAYFEKLKIMSSSIE